MLITKEIVKMEIDTLREYDLEVVYKLIKALEAPLWEMERLPQSFPESEQSAWERFVDQYAGCLRDAPITRGEQGAYDVREALR